MQRAIISSINILLRLHPQTIQLIVLAHTSMATPYNIDLTDRWSKTRTFFPITTPSLLLLHLNALTGIFMLTDVELYFSLHPVIKM